MPATVIPGLTVPLALMGTAAGMYLLGYSLDNLSLMALTISIGFIIDDAIVMLENIYRHIEKGMKPMAAALQGSSEIGFTIMSISVSLVAVFIPLLFMGGIVGRLFREFAVTVTMTIVISVLVSLTLTPMLCSRFLTTATPSSMAVCTGCSTAASMPCWPATGAGSTRCSGTSSSRCACSSLTLALTVLMFVVHPQGLLPAAGYRRPLRHCRERPGRLTRRDVAPHDAVQPTSCARTPT